MKTVFSIALMALPFVANSQFIDRTANYNLSNIGSNYGVSIVDTDNDGQDEIYVTCRGDEQNLYFDTFEESYELTINELSFSGDSYNSVWFDYDNDGLLDVYIGNNDSQNKLYHNDGDGVFTDVTEISGTGSMRNSLSLMAGDLNNDGWLDLYLANIHEQNQLYLNNGDGTFRNFTSQSGALDDRIAMGAMLFDYDNDGDLDIYLTHDSNQPNILYQNQGNATFKDVSEESGTNFAGFGMGVDFADFDRDGWLDIYITNLYENALLRNNGDGTFDEIAADAGVDDYGMGWGINCLDYDNDGWQDIYIVNNSFFSPYPNLLYKNNRNLTFDSNATSNDLKSPYAGYGSATTDIDQDGDLDIFVANTGTTGGNQLFINETAVGHWVKINTEGIESNRSGIGVRAEIHLADDAVLIDEVAAGTGYASQNSLTLHFGLGQEDIIQKIVLKWPSGQVDTYPNVGTNQFYKAVEGKGISTLNRVTSLTEDVPNLSSLKVYPNPAQNELTINLASFENNNDLAVSIIDRSGRTLREVHSDQVNSGVLTLAINDLPDGLYLLKLQTSQGVETTKFLKRE
ncbi:MAG: FG-GAP-like repeat-containing protein [Bacteroidota bacterium]